MKTIRAVISMAALALLAVLGPASAEGEVEFLKLQIGYEKSVKMIDETRDQNMVELGQLYADQLEQLEIEVRQTGDLDNTITVRNETGRFKKEGQMPSKPSSLKSLRLLQSTYEKAASGHAANRARDIVSLTTSYQSYLEKLQKSLVRADKLAVTEAVKEERERVRAVVAEMKVLTDAANPRDSRDAKPNASDRPAPGLEEEKPEVIPTVTFPKKTEVGAPTVFQIRATHPQEGALSYELHVAKRGGREFALKIGEDIPSGKNCSYQNNFTVWGAGTFQVKARSFDGKRWSAWSDPKTLVCE